MTCNEQTFETIETLVDRLQTATLLADRRDACRALLPLAIAHRVEVGARAIEPMLNAIDTNIQETELVNYCLRSLNFIISGPNAESSLFDEEYVGLQQDTHSPVPPDPGVELAEILLKKTEHMQIILKALKESDFETRRISLRLLRGLSKKKLVKVQEVIGDTHGVERLIELISEEQEVIRNEALLVLTNVTVANKSIQGLVEFMGIGKIIRIVRDENYSGYVTKDCLTILANVLIDNESNQLQFKEDGHIIFFKDFFDVVLSNQINNWSEDKTSCFILALQILDSMILPSNSYAQQFQSLMRECGLLDKLCELLSYQALPIGVYSEALNTTADIIRGLNPSMVIQTHVIAPALLLSMVKEMSFDFEKRIGHLDNYLKKLYEYMENMSTWNRYIQ